MKEPMWRRYARWFGADPAADVREELSFHLDARASELISQGWPPEKARAEARRQFGDLNGVTREGIRLNTQREGNAHRVNLREEFQQDVRFALRTLRRDKGFAITTVLILAIGIAANTSVFSVVNAVLLRPLPFANADRLAWLAADARLAPEERKGAGESAITYQVSAYEAFAANNKSFEAVTAYCPFFSASDYTLSGIGEPRAVSGVLVAGNFFQTLGVNPALGRLFSKEEMQKNGPGAVVLSAGFWRRNYGGDVSVVGKTVSLSGRAATIVAVLPASFDFGAVFAPGQTFDVFTPAVMDDMRNWGNTLSIVGRLRPGVSVSQAQSEATYLFPQQRTVHPEWYGAYETTVTGLKEKVAGTLRRPLMVLWLAVGMVQLLVCVNLSGLLLARSVARGKEFAMRGALGAGRWRLLRQALTEGLALSLTGATAGLALAFGMTWWLAHQQSIALPLLSEVRLDAQALVWTAGIAIAAGLAFAIAPGLKLSGGNLQDQLRGSGRGVGGDRSQTRLRDAMVVAEVALSCVLLLGAGLLMRSFLKVMNADLGFEATRAAVMGIQYSGGRDGTTRSAALQNILSQVRAIPGVEAAGITDMLPLGRNRSWGLRVKGRDYKRGEVTSAIVRVVTPGYLGAMGMRVRAGRDLAWEDAAQKEGAVVVNEAAARLLYPGQEALGRDVLAGGRQGKIVGIVDDVRTTDIEGRAGPEMYLHAGQAGPGGAELVVRSTLPAATLAPALMRTLRSINPSQPASELRPLRTIVERAVSPRRFFMMLVAGFAGLGLLLAALGIYGAVSWSVTRRTQEIGIRMALGAGRERVRLTIISRAMTLTVGGLVLGSAASFAVAKWISSLLYQTQPNDGITIALVVGVLGLVALIAGYGPALRASRIEPVIALRAQ